VGGGSDDRVLRDARAKDNFYFELTDVTPGADSERTHVSGIHTGHFALYFGRQLDSVDVEAVFPGSDRPAPTPNAEPTAASRLTQYSGMQFATHFDR
jgi:hypothetical protein